jgi:hypothetical protein
MTKVIQSFLSTFSHLKRPRREIKPQILFVLLQKLSQLGQIFITKIESFKIFVSLKKHKNLYFNARNLEDPYLYAVLYSETLFAEVDYGI